LHQVTSSTQFKMIHGRASRATLLIQGKLVSTSVTALLYFFG
jgi:hypothetical protein